MKFDTPLTHGRLIQRYKRFLADVELDDAALVTAHCANPGSMLGLPGPGAPVWLSPNANPKAKLAWRWELVDAGSSLVGINTARANRIVEEALGGGKIAELRGYASLRREVAYGAGSRVDFLLEGPGRCFVEVKSVTMRRAEPAEFPDTVTARGTKHLAELTARVAAGDRAVMLFLVQRGDCDYLSIARDIDPAYGAAIDAARDGGVEVLSYCCRITPAAIALDAPLPLRL